MALWPVGLPEASTTPRTRVTSRSATWAGVRSSAIRMPSPSMCSAGAPTQDACHLLSDVAYVGRPGAQVGVGQRRPAPPRPIGTASSQARCRGAAAADPLVDVVEQVGVVDQHQVRVEDPGVLVADLRRAATALTRWISRRTSATAPRIRRHSASVSSGLGRLVR